MPRDGALSQSDARGPTISIVCEPCCRRRRYCVATLIEGHGADAKMPDLLAMLANCPKAQSTNIYDRCKARYEGL
jgi:hypothetical protein